MNSETSTGVETSPTYWFAILDGALRLGDLKNASDAHTRLRDLGIDLRYPGGLRAEARRHAARGGPRQTRTSDAAPAGTGAGGGS